MAQSDFQIWKYFLKLRREEAKTQFDANRLVKRKFVLSTASENTQKNKFEPAPLLGMNVLDVGCGISSLGEDLALRGAEMTAIDTNLNNLMQAEESAQKYGTEITFRHAKPEELISENTKYDVILCLDVLEEVENQDKFLWALKKLLSSNGIIIFSNHNKNLASFLLHIVVATWVKRIVPWGYYKFSRFITPEALATLLQKNKLEIIKTAGLCFNSENKRWQKQSEPSVRYFTVARAAN